MRIEISDRGLKSLKNDSNMPARDRLLLLIGARTGGIEVENLYDLADELVEETGSLDAAIEFVLQGNAEFVEVEDE